MATVPKFEELPENLQKVLDPSKAKAHLMVAKGLAPLPASVLISSWIYLSTSENEELAAAAKESLTSYPENMMRQVIKGDLLPWVLAHLGKLFKSNENILEFVMLHPKTPAILFEYIARDCSERMAGIIAENQEKIIDRPQIILALEKNPINLKSSTDKLRQFLGLAGIVIPGDPGRFVEEKKAEAEPSDKKGEGTTKTEEDVDTLDEDEYQSLLQFIGMLNTGGKIKLAFKGNKEARSILIKDPNKIICSAVLKNPRLSDNEIAHYAALKNVADDVIRIISVHPQWTKAYAVKFGLVNNPKTPLSESMKFLKFMNPKDLKNISRSKTVPGPISKAAKEMVRMRMK